MPQLFLPEIETLADENPLMYEILFRIQQSINTIPVSSSSASPTPQPAVDPNTGLPLTDSSGNPLTSIPQATNPAQLNNQSTANTPAQENSMLITTDPTGLATGGYVFGGVWNPLWKRVTTKDLVGQGATKALQLGGIIVRGQNDVHGRPPSSFHSNVVDNMSVILTQPLTQHGTTHQIDVAAFTIQIGGMQINYNSGSVDPGSFGTFTVFFDDPLYQGGAVTFQVTASGNGVSIAKRGRYFVGSITTVSGGGGTGSGGGSGGGGGPCFSGNTQVITYDGPVEIARLAIGTPILTLNGWRRLEIVHKHLYSGKMIHMGRGEYVTPQHRIWDKGSWFPAEKLFDNDTIDIKRKFVYNLGIQGVDDYDHCYVLQNGNIAKNLCPY